jgi:hypothetical protein
MKVRRHTTHRPTRRGRYALLSVFCLATSGLAAPYQVQGNDAATALQGTIGVASTEDFRTVLLISPSSGAVRKVRAPDVMAGADISPNGRQLAITGVKGIWVFARSGARAHRLPIAPSTRTQWFGEVGWSADGKRLVYVDGGGLFITTVSGTRKTRLLAGDNLHEPDWSPRGGLIAFVRDRSYATDGPIQTIRADGRGLRSIVRGVQPDISPDGKSLAFVRRGNVYVKPLGRGRATLVVRKAAHPEWSPDGRYLAFTREIGREGHVSKGRVFIVRATGGQARGVGPAIFDIGPLSWSR